MEENLTSIRGDRDENAILREKVALYEAWFRAIDQNSNFDFWFKNADSNYTYVNPHFAKTMQKEKSVLENTPISELFEDDRFKRIQKLDQQVMHDEYLERVIPCDASGRLEMHEEHRFAVKDEMGNPIGLGCFAFEITDKSIAEQTLQQAEKLAKLCSWRWNAQTNTLISCSEHLADFLGVAPTETFKVFPNRLDAYVLDADKPAFQPVLDLMNGSSSGSYEIEYRIRKADGTIVYVLEKAEPISTREDTTEYLGFLKDISEQKKAEEALKASNERLEFKVQERTAELIRARDQAILSEEVKTRFLASISHELRTPLNAIIGFSEIIAKQRLGPLGGQEYVDISQHALDSGYDLLKTIENILVISGNSNQGVNSMNFEPLSLTKILDDAVEEKTSISSEKGIGIVWSKPESDYIINANPVRINRVFGSILCNAIRYNKAGGFVKIKISEAPNTKQNSGVFIDIVDTGIGIEPENLGNVMSPFFKVDNSSTTSYGGAGLGLAVAKQLVELHQGKISISSKVGKGTVVRIFLPAEMQNTNGQDESMGPELIQISA